MHRGTRRGKNQQGETLVELLMAISILGVAVVALVGGIGTSIVMSDIHRKQATAGTAVRTYAEAIVSGVATDSGDKYVPCAGPSAYQTPPGFAAPSGYTETVTGVLYWNDTPAPAKFSSTCSPDSGVQKLSLRVTSSDAKAAETLDVVIRKP